MQTPTNNAAGNEIPFGFWGLNGYHSTEGFAEVKSRFGITVFQVTSTNPTWTVGVFLPLIRDSGLKVTLTMVHPSTIIDPTGNFSREAWKAELDAWVDSGVEEFIDDGTLIGHMLLDDIYNFTGTDPTAEDLDEMAKHSKTLFPKLFTFVREQASHAPVPAVADSPSGTYKYVDAFVNQYTIDDGDIENYIAKNVASAESLGVGIMMGLNLCDGGDSSSGQRGWRTDRITYAMSAQEILNYGTALLNVPNVAMFLMWEYDGEELWSDGSIGADYFNRDDLQAALYQLGQRAAAY
ncbi:MAG: hypothetical protein WC636_05125 [Candidatus Margulisiibacteriota bacterium]